jgi:putative MATE family efflux protein
VRDLTRGSIAIHILTMAAPVALSMLAQIAYQLVDLYFVARIGPEATAGVNAAGNASFITSALAQVLSTGTAALIAQGVGRKDFTDTRLVFNQAIVLSAVFGFLFIAALCLLARPYMETVSTDYATVEAGIDFILCVSPGYALLFPMVTLSAILRGAGLMQPPALIVMLTVVLNAVLAPVFIAGWSIGPALGVKGAGLATSVSVFIGVACMAAYFRCTQRHMSLSRLLLYPRLVEWRRILAIGLPAGAEFALMFCSVGIVYFVLRDLGASAQAGFGIGSRILQTVLLPAVSVAFVAGPLAGQNFGARNTKRVRQVFSATALIGSIVMIAITILIRWWPTPLVGLFAADASTTATATLFLQLMSWSCVAQGLVYTCTFMFQGLGNMVPSLISAVVRFIIFAAAAVWLSQQPGFHIHQIWYLLTASIAMQSLLSLWFLKREFRRKLQPLE